MQEANDKGGLGVPDWKGYYQAAVLNWTREWMTLRNNRILELEGHDMQAGWHSFLWDHKHRSHSYFTKHFIRDSLLFTWLKIKKEMYRGIPTWFSPSEAIRHPNFKTIGRLISYKELMKEEGTIKSRSELKDEGIELEWWEYLQVKSRFEKDKRERGIDSKMILDKIFMGSDDKMIKKLYQYLLNYKMESEQVKENMIKWAQNFGYNIYLNEWQQIWSRNKKLTLATSYKENWFKMFYRWHITPTQLAKIDKKSSPRCWKCTKEFGSYYHIWWECGKTKRFWGTIQIWLEEMLGRKIIKKPELFLLGIAREKFEKNQLFLILHITTVARIAFAQVWKESNIPSEEEIIEKITVCAEMDKLTKELKYVDESEYYDCWEKFYLWLEKRKEARIDCKENK